MSRLKINKTAWANASALGTGVLYVACGALVAIVPDFMKSIARSWFHGIDLAENWSGRAFPGNFLFGLITLVVASWVFAYLFAWFYNAFSGKK